MSTTGANARENGALAAVDPRFLKRFDRWTHPARRFRRQRTGSPRGMSSLVRFVAGILSRLQSPAILHRTRTIFGGPLVRPLADLDLEDLIPDLVPHSVATWPAAQPPRVPAIRPAGSPPIATAPPVQAQVKTSPPPPAPGPLRPSKATFLASLMSAAQRPHEPGPSSPSGPAPDATGSPGLIASRSAQGSLVGFLPHRERSAFQATGDESPAPSTPSAIERLNQSLLQASRPVSDERPTFPVLHELAAPVPVGRWLPPDRSDARAEQSSPRILSESARSALAGFLGLDIRQRPPSPVLHESAAPVPVGRWLPTGARPARLAPGGNVPPLRQARKQGQRSPHPRRGCWIGPSNPARGS